MGLLFISKDWLGLKERSMALNTGQFFLAKPVLICERLETGRGSPSSKTMILKIHTAKATLEWFKGKHVNVLEWP